MGPPFLRGGESTVLPDAALIPSVKSASMGPPFLRGGEWGERMAREGRDPLLQWGRPFYGAERKLLRRSVLVTCRRSPGFNGAALFTGRRAFSTSCSSFVSRPLSFNGAALFTGRRVHQLLYANRGSATKLLQWGRPFYGAERNNQTATR